MLSIRGNGSQAVSLSSRVTDGNNRTRKLGCAGCTLFFWKPFATFEACRTCCNAYRGKGWAAYIEEVPGVNTQGAAIEETRENLREALQLVLETNREIARQREGSEVIREEMAVPA